MRVTRLVVPISAIIAAACSSSSPPAERVLGAYIATQAGPISKVTFSDATHYSRVFAECADGPVCADEGTYALSSDYRTISFKNQTTGATSTVPFHAVAVGTHLSPSPATTQGVGFGGEGGASDEAGSSDDSGLGGLVSSRASLLSDGGTCLTGSEFVSSFTLDSQSFNGGAPCPASAPVLVSSFLTPSSAGEQPVIDAINGAHTSIRMIMFHLTNPAVVTALVAAAKRKVNIQIILDQGNLASHTPTSITAPLAKAKIKVIPSSTAFAITHVKSLVVDNATAVISSMNLTMDFATTRDFGVVTTDDGIIKEFLSVFAADVTNAKKETGNTPKLSSPYLVWSPVDSESRLAAFAASAKKTLVATSENLGDAAIQAAMIAAAKRGVAVRIMSPLCDQNPNPLFDLPYLAALAAGGVDARVMPAPPSADTPYMHAKMMIADGTSAYVGSVNFSTSSTTKSRELGILFTDSTTIGMLSDTFEGDWSKAVTPPSESSAGCATTASDDG